jgi:hypothetical protein
MGRQGLNQGDDYTPVEPRHFGLIQSGRLGQRFLFHDHQSAGVRREYADRIVLPSAGFTGAESRGRVLTRLGQVLATAFSTP